MKTVNATFVGINQIRSERIRNKARGDQLDQRCIVKAAEDSRTPKPDGVSGARDFAVASWSAAVLCRFIGVPVSNGEHRSLLEVRFAHLCFLLICLFTGCKSFRPVVDLTRYYVLSASAVAGTIHTNQNVTIGIAPVEIPAYLQSSRIVVRRDTNEIHYSEYREWAEHLDKGIQRVLALDVSTLLRGSRVVTSAWHGDEVKFELYVSIQRFELNDAGEVTLTGQWRIVKPGGGGELRADRVVIVKKGPPEANNPAGAVSTMSEALAELSKQIVAALQTAG